MAARLRDMRVGILAADGVEKVEFVQPRDAVTDEGGVTHMISISPGEIQSTEHDIYPADRFAVDRVVGEVTVDDYDALILPGGVANPDKLRQHEGAVDFVRRFVTTGKPVAVICHAPWTLVEADVVRGRRLTSYPSIRTDIRNAGGNVVDEQVVVDDALVTSRSPKDLPAFCGALVDVFASSMSRT